MHRVILKLIAKIHITRIGPTLFDKKRMVNIDTNTFS